MAEFLLFLGDTAKHMVGSGRGRLPCRPDGGLGADADALLLLGPYDPYVDYAWNGSRLSDLEREAETLLVSRKESVVHQILVRTKQRDLEHWHQPMLDAALLADPRASFARELLALIHRAQSGGGTVVYSCD